MTEKQEFAIRMLESAFRGCKAAGLVFVGIEDTLMALPAKMLDTDPRQSTTAESVVQIINEGVSKVNVNTHGTYRDAGGA